MHALDDSIKSGQITGSAITYYLAIGTYGSYLQIRLSIQVIIITAYI